MRYFTLDTKKPLQYLLCGQLIDKEGFLHHRRSFDQHVFILVTEGVLYISACGKEYSVGANQYIFLKAGEEHFGYQTSKGVLSYYWVHIAEDCPVMAVDGRTTIGDGLCPEGKGMVPKGMAAGEIGKSGLYLFPEYGEILAANRVQRLFRRLIDLSLEESLYVKEMFDYTLSLLLMEISQEFACRKADEKQQNTGRKALPTVIVEAREWIRENYSRPFKVTELAAALGYQADYLSALFKQSVGISIVGYTNKIRIEAAKNLLETEGLPIKVVACSCGFTDEKYFMKVFKKLESSTPGEYRNSYK